MKPPATPKPTADLLKEIRSTRFKRILQTVPFSQRTRDYHHWDKLRHLKPPNDLTHEEWWLGLKITRSSSLRPIPLRDVSGQPFMFSMPDRVIEMLHRVDKNASGQIAISEAVTNPATRNRYVISSLIEEAITSSQLEGAATTNRVAREMLRTGRPPRTRDERMIVNNFQAMQLIGQLRNERLTPELIFDLHRVLTDGTLDNPDAAGRLQSPDEERVLVLEQDATGPWVAHIPPRATELPGRLQAMCDFANGGTAQGFVHPVVRAIVVHFWLAYDHPFEDGNGRTARALFYWSMLSQGYWLAEFLTISSILRKAPAKYSRSFLYTELDDNDLTYFLIYQLEVLNRSIDELHEYLARKMAEIRVAEALLKQSPDLNYRQLALLSHAMRNSDARYTIASHRTSHNISYETARSDLLALERRGFLDKQKRGRAFYFTPAPRFTEKLGATVGG
jgi:Fic family protein